MAAAHEAAQRTTKKTKEKKKKGKKPQTLARKKCSKPLTDNETQKDYGRKDRVKRRTAGSNEFRSNIEHLNLKRKNRIEKV